MLEIEELFVFINEKFCCDFIKLTLLIRVDGCVL